MLFELDCEDIGGAMVGSAAVDGRGTSRIPGVAAICRAIAVQSQRSPSHVTN